MLEWEMLKQNEIDKQREHEQNILEVELEAKRKMAQTEKEMDLKRKTVDIELKMKAEMEQKRLELEKQFGVPITRQTPTIKLPKLELEILTETFSQESKPSACGQIQLFKR